MNVLINSDEWIAPWSNDFAVEQVKQLNLRPAWKQTNQYLRDCQKEFKRSGLLVVDFKHVNYLIQKDLGVFRNTINEKYKKIFKKIKADTLIKLHNSGVSDTQIIQRYLNSNNPAFAKSIAPQLSDNLHWILDESQADWSQPFFIRNVVNKESLLNRCLREKINFWFVDTGYTNFLYEKQKVWHRLVHNHVHHGHRMHKYPTDRLHLLTDLPIKWRRKGSTILVVESSPNHYAMHGTTLNAWRQKITDEIRAVSDRPIEFRPKNLNRKTRQCVYNLLKETKEYYCVISDSSAAAVEAIWTGTPVITLDRHITNSVSRNNISQINDLYREDLSEWFAMISYSQFTFEELCDGTALYLTRSFGDV